MKTQLQREITTTFENLYAALGSFTHEQINTIPFEGSWTPGQVGEHLEKALSGYPKLASGETKESDRAADAKIQDIKNIFLDFSISMKSPDFLVLTKTSHDKNELIASFRQKEKEMQEVAEDYDLSKIVVGAEVPGMGEFTLFEWISFGLIHSQRHTHQLQKIRSHFN